MRIKRWISYSGGSDHEVSIGGWGGWFEDGMRWADFLDEFEDDAHPYFEAMRKSVLAKKIREGGFWHQSSDAKGMPLFEDDTVGSFTLRAWGDVMAAIWAEADDQDYNYVSFAWSEVPQGKGDKS